MERRRSAYLTSLRKETPGRHLSETLYAPMSHIMNSDDDQPVVIDLCAGFNVFGELVICADLHDLEEPAYNCSTAAVVNLEDSRRMARRNRVKPSELPSFIAECMEDWSGVVNPTLKEVRKCFKEITDCLIEEGCRFKIKRTYGKHDYMCC